MVLDRRGEIQLGEDRGHVLLHRPLGDDEGLGDRVVGAALVVSERAVEKHVTSIFSKLDLPPAVQDHRRVLAVLAFLRAS